MDFNIALGFGGWLALIAGALTLGVVAQRIAGKRRGYQFLVAALAGGIAALGASEFIVGWRAFGPVWDGLAIIPAVITGVIFGAVGELAALDLTYGSETRPILSP